MWKDLFGFNHSERKGTWVLFILMVISLLLNALFPLFVRPGHAFLANNELELLKLAEVFKVENTYDAKHQAQPEVPGLPHKSFDPNLVDPDRFVEYGLTKSQVMTLFRYTNAGGKFRKAADLARMRNLSQTDLERIEPFLIFPETHQITWSKPSRYETISIPDLNTADTSLLMRLPGIGKVLANRMIKYREMLGGYYDPEQIREIYGMPPETADRIIPNLAVDATKIRKLNVRTDSFKVLLRHPYLDAEMVKTIFKTRRTKPEMLHADSMGFVLGLPLDKANMLKPYIQ